MTCNTTPRGLKPHSCSMQKTQAIDRWEEGRTDTDVALDATQVSHPEQTGFLEGAVQFEPKIRFQYTHCICIPPYTSWNTIHYIYRGVRWAGHVAAWHSRNYKIWGYKSSRLRYIYIYNGEGILIKKDLMGGTCGMQTYTILGCSDIGNYLENLSVNRKITLTVMLFVL